jgi:hypothetical protein
VTFLLCSLHSARANLMTNMHLHTTAFRVPA